MASFKDSGGSRDPYVPPAPPVPPPVVSKPKVTSNSKGNYVRPAAPPPVQQGPVIPSIDAYLNQDTGYQQQLRQFAQSLGDLNADVTRRRGSLETQYGLSQKALQDQRVLDLKNLEDDYGARGLLRSGLYGDAVGNYEKEFGQRNTDLTRQEENALAQLAQQQGQFTSSQQLQQQAAKEAAIRRRAEQYGV